MRIIVAPDSFKGCLDATDAARSISCGVSEVCPEADVIMLPLADGGEGTAQLYARYSGGASFLFNSVDPLGRPLEAHYYIADTPSGPEAFLDLASASGLTLLSPDERNPYMTSTFGTGLLLQHVLQNGCRNVTLALGGSATIDCGAGLLKGLGVRFFDSEGEMDYRKVTGGGLGAIRRIETGDTVRELLEGVRLRLACDVTTPLLGRDGSCEGGAVEVFGMQKGLRREEMPHFRRGVESFVRVIEQSVGKDISGIVSGGAAGGVAATLWGLLGAEIADGAELMLRCSGFHDKVKGADLVITGEGKSDLQTLMGKLPEKVRGASGNIPVILMAGMTENEDELMRAGFKQIININEEHYKSEDYLNPEIASRRLSLAAGKVIKKFL